MNADILFTLWLSDFKSFESFSNYFYKIIFIFPAIFFSIYFFLKKSFGFVFIILAILIGDFLGALLKEILSEESFFKMENFSLVKVF